MRGLAFVGDVDVGEGDDIFCTGGFDSSAANVISLLSVDERLEAATGGEEVLLMGCPLTSLSRRDGLLVLPTSMTLSLPVGPKRACRLGLLSILLTKSLGLGEPWVPFCSAMACV